MSTISLDQPRSGRSPQSPARSPVEGLRTGRLAVGIWGLGYLGYHNLVRAVSRRMRAVVTDPLPERLALVRSDGFVPGIMRNFHGFGVGTNDRAAAGVEACSADLLASREDIGVHLICLPAEHQGQPSDAPLIEAIESIVMTRGPAAPAPLIVIESFSEPGLAARVIQPTLNRHGVTCGVDAFAGVAPRLDYGRSPFASAEEQVRVVGGVTPACTSRLAEFYDLMGFQSRAAGSPLQAELACAAHRGAAHLLMSYANQMAMAYPEEDIRAVMALASAQGNAELAPPGLGSSGYFLPVSAQQLRGAAPQPEMLTLLDETFRCDLMMTGVVADRLLSAGLRRIALLGLASQPDVKNHVRSPAIKLAARLQAGGASVAFCDPLYVPAEIEALTGCGAIDWPDGLEGRDGVVLITGHHPFLTLERETLLARLSDARMVLDCTGAWADQGLREANLPYAVLGSPGWLR